MRYFISHHQHKGTAIDEALKKEGWQFKRRRVDIALFDHNVNRKFPEKGRGILSSYYDQGATIVMYPHGATGAWWADSERYPTSPKIFANLVIGEGHKEIETFVRPQLQHYVIGWSFCPIKEFQKPKEVKNILFAPIHAFMSNNTLSEDRKLVNTKAFEALLELSDQYKITVRYLNPPECIGIWKDSRVRMKFGKPDGSYNDIDEADLVISEGTYMYLSVARGKPTIGLNQYVPQQLSLKDEHYSAIIHWDEYKDFVGYPIDFYDAPLPELIERAVSEEQSEWKRLFIGKEMDSAKLSQLLQSLRNEDLVNRN